MIADALTLLALAVVAIWSTTRALHEARRHTGETDTTSGVFAAVTSRPTLLVVGPPALLVLVSLAQLGWTPIRSAPYVVAAGAVVLLLVIVTTRVTGATASIAGITGAWMLSCLGAVTAERLYQESGVDQAYWLCLAALVFVIAAIIGSRWRTTPPLNVGAGIAVIGCVLLMLPLIPGIGVRMYGAPGWITVGPLTGQPGDIARLLIIAGMGTMYYAVGPAVRAGRLGPVVRSSWPMLAAAGIGGLTSDLGPVLVLGGAVAIMLGLCGPPLRILLGMLAVITVAAMGLFVVVGKLRDRLDQMLNPITSDGKYQNTGLAQLALARGGGFGTGFGHGNPHSVANVDNDFVLAGIGEERGMLALVAVLALFTAVTIAVWASARRASSGGPRLVAAGLAAMLTVQSVYVVCAALNIAPVTGMVVPFLSRGGSSLMGVWGLLGVAVGLGAHRERKVYSRAEHTLGDRVDLAGHITVAAWMTLCALLLVLPTLRPIAPNDVTTATAPGKGPMVLRDGTPAILVSIDGDDDRLSPDVAPENRAAFNFADSVTGLGACSYEWSDEIVMRKPCRTVVSSIAPAVQDAARTAFLDAGVEGDAVAIDTASGEILALYSTPQSRQPAGIEDGEVASPAVYTASAPGSTFKVVVAAAATNAGINTTTPVLDSYVPPGGTSAIHNAGLVDGGGRLETALAESSNTAFADIATRTGGDDISAMAETLSSWPYQPGTFANISRITVGVDLDDPDALARTGIGQQDVRATPLAMAVVAGNLTTNGAMPSPRLQAGLCDGTTFARADGHLNAETLSPTVTTPVLDGMRQAVTTGHAGALADLDIPIAAKTGTADDGQDVYDGWIIATSTQIAVAVRIWASEAGVSRSGAADASPIASNVLQTAQRGIGEDVNPCAERTIE